MTEANKFLDSKGYDEFKIHENVSAPKIRIQSIMQEYADQETEPLKKEIERLKEIITHSSNQLIMIQGEESRRIKELKKQIEELKEIKPSLNK